MSFTARVLLRLPGRDMPVDLGVIDVDPRPIRFGRTAFAYQNRLLAGRVERIDPSDWDSRPGTIPWILVEER
jgi:hypothetical protein